MKIVIDIPEELFGKIDDENYQSVISWYDTTLYCAIKNGIPLPKGHGRLIDADALWESLKEHRYSDGFCTEHNIDYSINLGMSGIVIGDSPTIIEADKEYDVKAITRGNCMACGKELTEGAFFCKECEEKGRKEGAEE